MVVDVRTRTSDELRAHVAVDGDLGTLAPARSAAWRTRITGARATELRSLVRFAGVGLAANGSYGLVFLVLGEVLRPGAAVLHVLSTAVSTVVANEMHRRFTFAHGERRSWVRGHGVGTAAAAVGFVATSLALSWWHVVAPGASHVSSVLVVYATTAAVGLGNFLALRRTLGAARRAA